ncbi:MAG: iron ABC transporter permease [Bacteriovoracaceae bacterium]|nr:iron ABC transporter permease [Bacteriovoracaceae bacterium]
MMVFTLLSMGPIYIPFEVVTRFISGQEVASQTYFDILWQIRVPKILTGILAGSALSIAGLVMQTYFGNPLAGPFVLGISSGSALGVALWVMTSSIFLGALPEYFNDYGLVASGIFGGSIILLLLMLTASKVTSKVVLLVMGLLFGHFTSGIISVLVAKSGAQEIKTFLLWGLGSFERVSGNQLLVFLSVVVFAILCALLLIKPLNSLLLGEQYAKSMGLNISRFKYFAIVITAILAGSVTAFCGPIIFLGTVIPHLARWIFKTSDHKVLMPGVILLGSIFSLIAENIASGFFSLNIPLNAIMGLMGVPIIVVFMWSKQKDLRS